MRWIVILFMALTARAETRVLDGAMHHLGAAGDPEWNEFRNVPVEGPKLDVVFTASKNTNEWTLFWRQRDVKVAWMVQLNGRTFTNLFLSEDDLVMAIPLAPGAFKEGTNTLTIVPPKERDDIEVGNFNLETGPLKEALGQGKVEFDVGMPCRVTIVDSKGSLFPMLVLATNAAVRPGVAYLGEGRGVVELPAGKYTAYVGRGFEYSVVTNQFTIDREHPVQVEAHLKREVDTRGYAASDTHVHTFTYSRHGDATAEERAITLAGEGIELPISTDHNIVIDPVAPAKATGMDRYFTPVVGDEVTTGHAHFNIFPVQPGTAPPDFRIYDWPQLMREMRATPGVKVVVLNHPRNIHNHFQPFAATNFNAQTGENLRGFEFSFDAVEVVNSSALQTDWMINFRDWMALLNYGYRVTGVGSSDGHDVSRYIVGQGRTYIACDDSDPSKIDVNTACENLRQGRALISMGLFTEIKVNDRWQPGDLATNLQKDIQVTVTVQGPSWTAVDDVKLYRNGAVCKSAHFAPIWKGGVKGHFHWTIPNSTVDTHLIAIASGPPVTAPFWRIPKPYQPTSTTWKPRVVGATNPVYLDCDGDGKLTPPPRIKTK